MRHTHYKRTLIEYNLQESQAVRVCVYVVWECKPTVHNVRLRISKLHSYGTP